jgi:hypothetical protein
MERSIDASGNLISNLPLTPNAQAGMNDPMVDIGMGRTTDVRASSTVPTLSPIAVTPANASPDRLSSLQTQKFPNEFAEEAASPGAGIDKLSSAKTVNSTVPGAPRGNVAPTSMGAEQTGRPRSAYDDFLDEIRAGREDLKTQAQKDKYMAIISAGLGMMSGTSPNAFANIGQGAQAGVASYMASGKQRAAEKAALNKNLLMGRRYQSMEDVANRTADINERRIAAIAASRGAGNPSKEEIRLDRREKSLADMIKDGAATVDRELKAMFPFGVSGADAQKFATAKAALQKQYNIEKNTLLLDQLRRKRDPDFYADLDESQKPPPIEPPPGVTVKRLGK